MKNAVQNPTEPQLALARELAYLSIGSKKIKAFCSSIVMTGKRMKRQGKSDKKVRYHMYRKWSLDLKVHVVGNHHNLTYHYLTN